MEKIESIFIALLGELISSACKSLLIRFAADEKILMLQKEP